MENHKCCVCEKKKSCREFAPELYICKKCDNENFEVDENAKLIKKTIVRVGG